MTSVKRGSPSSDGAAAGYFAWFDQSLMLMPAEARVCYAAVVGNMNTIRRYTVSPME
jgi:hypothetical protein